MNTITRICILLSLAVTLATTMGCDDSSSDDSTTGGVKFENDSSHVVTVTWRPTLEETPGSLGGTFSLEPGQEHTVENLFSETVYYDWTPKDSVAVNQIAADHIIFADK